MPVGGGIGTCGVVTGGTGGTGNADRSLTGLFALGPTGTGGLGGLGGGGGVVGGAGGNGGDANGFSATAGDGGGGAEGGLVGGSGGAGGTRTYTNILGLLNTQRHRSHRGGGDLSGIADLIAAMTPKVAMAARRSDRRRGRRRWEGQRRPDRR